MTPKERMEMKQRKAQEDAVKKGLKPRQSGADLVREINERQAAKNRAAGIRPTDPTKYQDKRDDSRFWKDVNDWRDIQDYRVRESDRNDEGVDSTLIRIMIPKRKGVDVMKDVERIENEIGALSHNITMVIGEISGETGSHWAVDFTVEWDFAHSNGRSDKFLELLLRNIENNIEGIGSIKLV